MKAEKIIHAGGLTRSEIDALKKKEGALKLISLNVDDTKEHYWLKKPDMKTLSAAGSKANTDPMGAAVIYFVNCLVMGDESAAQDAERFVNIAPHLNDLLAEYDVEVKNF